MKNRQEILAIHGISKTYSEPVLVDVTLALYSGKVLALTGENGAGKSTLAKIIGGLTSATSGQIIYQGKPYTPNSRKDAEKLGIRMVMQELNLLPTLSVAENLFLEQLPHRFGWIDRKKLNEVAQPVMAMVGLQSIDPNTLVGKLGIGHQQMIEIARNLIGESRVLILDESTAMLSNREVELLFKQIMLFKARGVSLIYISHRLDELAVIADDIAVLRNGHLVCVDDIKRYNSDQLVSLMVGRDLKSSFNLNQHQVGHPILKVKNFKRGRIIQDTSFTLHSGEILGISGLVGSGRTELLRAIFGADKIDSGTLQVGDPLKTVVIRSPKDAIKHGIALVTEDRKGEGLLLPQSIAANISLGNSDKTSFLSIVSSLDETNLANKYIKNLGIRATNPSQPVKSLSGGNQQKVLISRWLERDCQIILFDEPTRGIDIGAKQDIYQLLNALTAKGKGIVVVSSDLRELMLICDRIAVISDGKLVNTFSRGDWSQEQILAAAFSAYQHVENTSSE